MVSEIVMCQGDRFAGPLSPAQHKETETHVVSLFPIVIRKDCVSVKDSFIDWRRSYFLRFIQAQRERKRLMIR
jgi:hypothetical protein